MNAMRIAAIMFAAPLTLAVPQTASAQEAVADNSAREALALQIIDIAYPKSERLALFSKTADQMEAQMLQSIQPLLDDEGAMDIVREFQADVRGNQDAILIRHIPKLMVGWTKAYAEMFSEQELRDILAFVQTTSGKSFISKSAEAIGNPHFAEANQAYMQEAMAAVMAEVPNLMQKISAYKQAQESSAQ